jgi:hypothetical protein
MGESGFVAVEKFGSEIATPSAETIVINSRDNSAIPMISSSLKGSRVSNNLAGVVQ